MKRRQFLAGTGLILTGCVNPHILVEQYFKEKQQKDLKAIQAILNSYLGAKGELETITEMEMYGNRDNHKQSGMGIAYEDKLLTLGHVVHYQPTQYGFGEGLLLPVKKLAERTELNGQLLELIVANDTQDIAVFKLPKDYKGQRYPFGLGDSKDIKFGDEIIMIGNPRMEGYNIRFTTVSSPCDGNGFFTLNTHIIEGDSGTGSVSREDYKLMGLNARRKYGFVPNVIGIDKFKTYL